MGAALCEFVEVIPKAFEENVELNGEKIVVVAQKELVSQSSDEVFVHFLYIILASVPGFPAMCICGMIKCSAEKVKSRNKAWAMMWTPGPSLGEGLPQVCTICVLICMHATAREFEHVCLKVALLHCTSNKALAPSPGGSSGSSFVSSDLWHPGQQSTGTVLV